MLRLSAMPAHVFKGSTPPGKLRFLPGNNSFAFSMELAAAYNKLERAGTALLQKIRELNELATTLAAGTHRIVPRVEVDQFRQILEDLDYALGEHAQARENFFNAMRGE